MVDLAAVRTAIGNARVVALGEAGHNIAELHELRDDLFRMLVEDLGFTALVLESGFAEGLELDAWVSGAPGNVEDVARQTISHGFGNAAEVHRQLDWMRSYGAARVYGMDLPGGSTSPGPAVRALLARIAPEPGDVELLARSDLGGRVEAAIRYAGLEAGDQERLRLDLRALADRAATTDDPVVERLGASIRAFAEEHDRDAFMAATVRWVLQREERVLISAHNGHVQRVPLNGESTLGSLLADELGEDLVVLGTTFTSGPAVRITDRTSRPFDWTVALDDQVPGPALAEDAFDQAIDLGAVHRVAGAYERLRHELAAPWPPTRTVDVVETQAGIDVPDPYRWLEAEDEEVHTWQRRQAEIATGTILGDQERAALGALIKKHDAGARPTLPRHAAGRWFRPDGAAIVVATEPYGAGTQVVVLEPGAVLSWIAPSPDGRRLAVGVCRDGSEHNTIRLVDVATREHLPAPAQVLHSAWAGGVAWAADSGGFWFFALIGSAEAFSQATFHHDLVTGVTVLEPIPLPEVSREYTLVQPSPDGRWLVAAHRVGSPIPVAVRDLADAAGGWRPFLTSCTGTVAGHVVGDRYVAVTDVGAARGRLVAIPLDAADPDDVDTWDVLLPEGPGVLRSVTPVGEHLYLTELDRTFARVRVLEHSGAIVGEVPLPDRGTIAAPFFPLTALAVGPPSPDFLFAFSTLTTSWSVHRHTPDSDGLQTLVAPAVSLDAVVEEDEARAADGTMIPFHIVRPSAASDRPAATLITAYGAANVATLPSYQPDLAAFAAAGGTVVQAYLRGGGEFGRDWYLAAHRETKHVRDDDLLAVAEHLLATGRVDSAHLAVTGGSDGGLMCGVAVTTRPDLWCAVAPRAPLLDLVAGMRDPYLEFVIRKAWGDPDNADDVQRMIGRSPYALIQPGHYPAVYVQAGANDPRCRPWHARKFVARLQTAQHGEAPILLHVFENAGHGAATDHEILLAQDVEWLGFLVRQLGLTPPMC